MTGPKLSLWVMSKAGLLRRSLGAGRLVAGRGADCDLVLDDAKASRRHLLIEVGATVTVSDEGSRNGTILDGHKLVPHQPAQLRIGVPLVIGSTVIILQHEVRELPPLPLVGDTVFAARFAEEVARGRLALLAIRFQVLGARLDANTQSTAATEAGVTAVRLDLGLRELVRPGDLLVYTGPAEYLMLLVGASATVAEKAASRLRTGLVAHEVPADVGVATFPEDGNTQAALAAVARANLRPATATVAEPVRPPGAIDRLLPMIDRVAAGNINVLVLGETGVGKEVLSRLIHRRSKRAAAPLVCLNCAALSESLLESELFGYERGAFTGAVQAKPGLLEAADGGTVLLDEIGDMPPSVQARLLRVLEAREVTRLGSVKPRSIDIRVISATNRDLEADIRAGRFRQDLYFRINGAVLTLPPLRERLDEIAPLATAFMAQICRDIGRATPPTLSPETLAVLVAYAWPGNVRELRNVIERAVLLVGDGATITPDDLPLDRLSRAPAATAPSDERQRIVDVLEACAGNQTRAAERLGISRRTLVSRLKQFAIPRPHKRD